jgi:hypothetical protein
MCQSYLSKKKFHVSKFSFLFFIFLVDVFVLFCLWGGSDSWEVRVFESRRECER